MRLLQLVQTLTPGGAERVALTLAGAARARGDSAAVAGAPGSWSERFGEPRFPMPILERRPHRTPAGALATDRAIRSFRPDVVHAHNPGMGLVAALATLRGRRVPALVSVHGVPEEDYPRTARLLRRSGLPVVSCGPGVTAGLEEHGCRVEATIVNGVAPAPPAADAGEVRARFGVPATAPLVVCVGRLVSQKHHDLAIAAMAEVPGAALLVVGAGPLDGELRAAAERAGVGDRVVLTGARDDARAILGAADVAVLASHWEGLPLVALEAFAAGVPLVATAVRGVRELVTDQARLVPPGDPATLATAIREVLADPALAAGLAGRGRKTASRYSEAAMVEDFFAFYARLLGRRQRR